MSKMAQAAACWGSAKDVAKPVSRDRSIWKSGLLQVHLWAGTRLSKQPETFLHHPWQDCSKATSQGVVAFRGSCYNIIYDEKSGPQNMGRLLVHPFGPPETSTSVDPKQTSFGLIQVNFFSVQ